MMKRSHHIGVSLPLVGDMLCSLLTLPTGLQWVNEGYDIGARRPSRAGSYR